MNKYSHFITWTDIKYNQSNNSNNYYPSMSMTFIVTQKELIDILTNSEILYKPFPRVFKCFQYRSIKWYNPFTWFKHYWRFQVL